MTTAASGPGSFLESEEGATVRLESLPVAPGLDPVRATQVSCLSFAINLEAAGDTTCETALSRAMCDPTQPDPEIHNDLLGSEDPGCPHDNFLQNSWVVVDYGFYLSIGRKILMYGEVHMANSQAVLLMGMLPVAMHAASCPSQQGPTARAQTSPEDTGSAVSTVPLHYIS